MGLFFSLVVTLFAGIGFSSQGIANEVEVKPVQSTTDDEVLERIRSWFALLDNNGPDVEAYRPYLSSSSLEIQFPGAPLITNFDGFIQWYAWIQENVTDPRHRILMIDVKKADTQSYEISIVVRWDAVKKGTQDPMGGTFYQSWTMQRDATDTLKVTRNIITMIQDLDPSQMILFQDSTH